MYEATYLVSTITLCLSTVSNLLCIYLTLKLDRGKKKTNKQLPKRLQQKIVNDDEYYSNCVNLQNA